MGFERRLWIPKFFRLHSHSFTIHVILRATSLPTPNPTQHILQSNSIIMAPKRAIGGRGAPRAPQGFFASTYDTLTSSENAAMVRSIGVFAVSRIYLPTS